MKTIVIPTDFSENAALAFRYGLMLANETRQHIILFHAVHLPHEVVTPPAAASFEELEKKAIDELRLWKESFSYKTNNVSIDCFVKTGFAADEIISFAKEKNIDMIIMATKGATGLLDKMMGSITSTVIEKAQCPVLAIPENTSLNNIRRIVFATDYRDNDFETLGSITEIAKNFNAEIAVLHVVLDDKNFKMENANFDSFANKINNTISYQRFAFRLMKGKNVEEELIHFLKEVETDMLVVSTAKRNFISKLFNHSVTNKIAQHPEIPLLVFHVKSHAENIKASLLFKQ